MKIKRFLVLFVSAILLLCTPLTACGNPEQNSQVNTGAIFQSVVENKIELYGSDELVVNQGLSEDLVEWSSSDPTILVVDRGKIVALKVGEVTITAKYGSATQEEKITVADLGAKPEISVSDVAILKGQKALPQINTTFKGVEMEGVTYSFTSANTSVVAVDGQKLSAVAVGSAAVTVKANWNGIVVAEKTFNCAVNQNNGIVLNRHSFDLFVADNVKGVAYEKQVEVTATVYEQGNEVLDAVITWKSENPEIATITDKGELSAVSVGTTFIEGTCTYNGKTVKTAKVPVSVSVPILETNVNVVLDLNRNIEVPDAGQILNVGDHDIGKIVDIYTGRIYAEDGNSLMTNQFAPGEYRVIVYSADGKYGVEVNLIAAEYIIDGVEDFERLNAPENRAKYMVLTKDVDFNGKEYKNIDNQHTNETGNPNYFTGTLNGLGHTIKNIRIGSFISGLFTGSKGSTIKNLGMTATIDRANSAVLFYWFRESPTTIDNVYLDVKIKGDPATVVDKGKWPAGYGAGVVATHGLNASINMNNCFFRVENDGASILSTSCGAIMAYAYYGSAIYNGCYVISPDFKLFGQTNHTNNRFESEYNMTPNVLYDSDESFVLAKNRANSPINLSGFNHYWDLSGDVPVFISAS